MAKAKPISADFKELKKSYKSTYSSKEWAVREHWYVTCCNDLDLPFEPSVQDLQEILHKSNYIFTQAKLDYALYSKLYEKTEKQIYLKSKDNIIKVRQQGLAKTDEMAKAMAIQMILDEKVKVNKNSTKGLNLYDLSMGYNQRLMFVNSITAIAKEIQSSVITSLGLLKLESNYCPDDTN